MVSSHQFWEIVNNIIEYRMQGLLLSSLTFNQEKF
jgi:hypothetical protein